MNISEIFLLSLINQSPRYGYEIAHFLEESNANLWVNISMPYVYRLLRNFEQQGWVISKVVESINRPNKNIYEITKKGHAALLETLKSEKFASDKVYFGMDVALAAYTITDKSFDLLSIIEAQIRKIIDDLEQFDLESIEQAELSDEAAMAMLIIEHRVSFLQSELKWLNKVKTIIKNNEKL